MTSKSSENENPQLVKKSNLDRFNQKIEDWTGAKVVSPDLIVNHRDQGEGTVKIPVNITLATTAPEIDDVVVTVEIDAEDGGDLNGQGSGLRGHVQSGDIETNKGVTTTTRLSTAAGGADPLTIEYSPDRARTTAQGVISARLNFTFDFSQSTVFNFNKKFEKKLTSWIIIKPFIDTASATFQTAQKAREAADQALGAATRRNTEFLSKSTEMYVVTTGGSQLNISNERLKTEEIAKNVLIDGIMGIDKTIRTVVEDQEKEQSDCAERFLGPTFTYNGADDYFTTSTTNSD